MERAMKRDAIEVNDRQVCFNSYVPILDLSATVNLKPIRHACRNFPAIVRRAAVSLAAIGQCEIKSRFE